MSSAFLLPGMLPAGTGLEKAVKKRGIVGNARAPVHTSHRCLGLTSLDCSEEGVKRVAISK